MSDPPQSDTAGSPPQDFNPVDVVIDALERRTVGPVDRGRLHRALERADAPLVGRAGADEATRRAIGGGHR